MTTLGLVIADTSLHRSPIVLLSSAAKWHVIVHLKGRRNWAGPSAEEYSAFFFDAWKASDFPTRNIEPSRGSYDYDEFHVTNPGLPGISGTRGWDRHIPCRSEAQGRCPWIRLRIAGGLYASDVTHSLTADAPFHTLGAERRRPSRLVTRTPRHWTQLR